MLASVGFIDNRRFPAAVDDALLTPVGTDVRQESSEALITAGRRATIGPVEEALEICRKLSCKACIPFSGSVRKSFLYQIGRSKSVSNSIPEVIDQRLRRLHFSFHGGALNFISYLIRAIASPLLRLNR